MRKLKKILCVFGVMVLTMGFMTACSSSLDEGRSTPEESLENYMATVKAGEIEKSYEFMGYGYLEANMANEGDSTILGEEWEEKVKDTKGYKSYQKELKNIYSGLEYEVTDTQETEGFDDKRFMIDLTMPNIQRINEEVIDDIADDFLKDLITSSDEGEILKGLDKMYSELAKALGNTKDMTETVSSFIIFVEGGTEEDEFVREWYIAGMGPEFFERLVEKKEL